MSVAKFHLKPQKIGLAQKAFVFNEEGKFLTLRRTKTAPSNPLKWDLPGGDVEFGELPQAAMLREIKEESGLRVKELRAFDTHSYIDKRKGEYWFQVAYRARTISNSVRISWEHDQYKWVSVEQFLKLPASNTLKKFTRTLGKVQ